MQAAILRRYRYSRSDQLTGIENSRYGRIDYATANLRGEAYVKFRNRKEMSEKKLAKVMSGWLLSYSTTKNINRETFETRFSLFRIKDRSCFRLIHEEYFSKYQDAGDLYDVDKIFDLYDINHAIKYLEEHGISINDMH